jgi:hypothetical protein
MKNQGMFLDGSPSTQPEGTYRHALNKVVSVIENAVIDEQGVTDLGLDASLENIIYTISVSFNKTVLLRQDCISVFDGTSETIIVKDALLDIAAPVKGVSYKNYKADTLIVWRDENNPIRFLNIDDPDLTLKEDKSLDSEDELKKLKFFPDYQIPEIYNAQVNDSGGNLKSGAYSLAVAYETKDGFLTDFANVSNPVFITDSPMGELFYKVDGCLPGTPTSKTIRFDVRGLDTNFKKAVFAIISHIGTEETARIAAETIISSGEASFLYTGNEFLDVVAIEQVTVPTAKYTKSKTLSLAQDSIYFANLETESRIDYQAYANAIQTSWVYALENSVSLNTGKGSYKDAEITFLDKTFMPTEVYAFYIQLIRVGGKRTEAFHIPGRFVRTIPGYLENVKENHAVSSILETNPTKTFLSHDLQISEDIKFFHTRETARSDGTMAYWENEEVYPEWFPGLNGQKVRHHKMPGMSLLSQEVPLIDTSLGYISFTESGINQISEEVFQDTQTVSLPSREIEILADGVLKIDYRAHVHIPDANLTEDSIQITLSKNGVAIVPSATEEEDPMEATLEGVEEDISVVAGDKIKIDVFYSTSSQNVQTEVDIEMFHNVEAEEAGIVSPVLGVSFSNIEIPESLRSEICGYEILYAKRGYDNLTVFAKSPAVKEATDNENNRTFKSDVDSGDKVRFYSPDFLANYNYPQAAVSFFISELLYEGKETFLHRGSEPIPPKQTYQDVSDDLRVVALKNAKYDPYAPDKMYETAYTANVQRDWEIPDRAIVSLMVYKKNMYYSFQNQKLASVGRVFLPAEAGMSETGNVFGGDCYFGEYSVWLSNFVPESEEGGYDTNHPYNCTQTARVHSWFTFSVLNPNLRYEGTQSHEKYYPRNIVPKDFLDGYVDFTVDHCFLHDNFHAIDFLTTKLNDYISSIGYDGEREYVDKFPTRIVGGSVIQKEGSGSEARTFKLNDYYEMPRNKGEIVNMEWFLNKMLIHHEDTLFIASTDTKLENTEYEIILGAGKLFSIPPQELLTSQGGYAGLQHIEGAQLTKVGYFFVDDRRAKVFLFSEGLSEISNSGLHEFFRMNVLGTGNYALGYDDVHKRLLLTKNDETPHTVSFSLQTQKWASFHSYIPNLYFVHANQMHAVYLNNIFRHGNPLTRATYYSGVQQPTYIDLVFYGEGKKSLFSAFSWKSFCYDDDKDDVLGETFNKAVVLTNVQLSQEIDLVNKVNIRNLDGEWRFNSFRDILDPDKRGSLIINLFGQIDGTLLDGQTDWTQRKRFINKWVILRLINTNDTDNILYLHSADSYQRKVY